MIRKCIVIILVLVMCAVPVFSSAEEAPLQEQQESEQVNAPEKVKGVKLSCSSKNSITISWKASSGADGYKVYRWNSSKKEYVCIKTTEKVSYVDSGRKSHKKYIYRVKAYKEYTGDSGKVFKKYGPRSEKKYIWTKVILNKVKNVKAKGRDWNKVRITWTKVSGATGYKIYRWNGSRNKYVLVGKTKKTGYVDSGLYPHTRYTYKVAAYKVYRTTKGKKVTKTGPRSEKDRAYTLKTVDGYRLAKPLKKMTVGSSYGWRGGAFHQGVDFIRPHGTPVYAATSGYVYRSRDNYGGLGKGIVIKNKNGVTTWYGHLSKRLVKQGSYVKKGQKIGKVGSTGNAGSCNHLHFEVWVNGSHYNPMKFY